MTRKKSIATGTAVHAAVEARMRAKPKPPDHDDYEPLLKAVRFHFELSSGGWPLFTTNTDGRQLFELYLANLPANQRQIHNCHACRRFFERYGGLVTIDGNGVQHSAMWGNPPDGIYQDAICALQRTVERTSIHGVFLSSDKVWGDPVTRVRFTSHEWHHLAVTPSVTQVYQPTPLKNAAQAMAEKLEDFRLLSTAVVMYDTKIVNRALAILESDALYRSEKVIGPAQWLADLHTARGLVRGQARVNLLWRAVATAPAGFCHVESTMVGTLLEDLRTDLPLEDIKRRFNAKMSPLQYQRPQAAPSAGNIARAEKIVAELRSAGALERRYARLGDIQALWRPPAQTPETPAGGVFSHLAPKRPKPPAETLPGGTMTWVKFRDKVLPEAEKIEVSVPARGAFIALVTASRLDAPPIIQWDLENDRNPVSWYVYPMMSSASQWNLAFGRWVEVPAVTTLPCHWSGRPMTQFSPAAIFLLEGCRDRGAPGSGLFPEILRSEYREIRSTLEAYSQSARLDGAEDASACGIELRANAGSRTMPITLRVTSHGGTRLTTYTLDRWD